MDDDDDEVEDIEARRWHWASISAAAANFAGNIGRAASLFFDDIAVLAAQHAAVQHERDDLISSAHMAIESLPVQEWGRGARRTVTNPGPSVPPAE